MSTGFTGKDAMRANSDRGLPWWVGTSADQPGRFTNRPGLVTIDEALAEGGLDFTVSLKPLQVAGGKRITTHKAVVADDNHDVLGVVGNKYRVIQYRDGLGEFGEAILATDEASIDTAMTMFDRKVGVLAFELDHLKGIKVKGEKDGGEVRGYLLLSTAHDGSRALTASITPVRVVCQNTLNMALKGAKSTFKVRHSGGVNGKVTEARRVLGISIDYMARFEDVANRLALKEVVDSQVAGIMSKVWPMDEELGEAWKGRHPATLATDLYFGSETLEGIRGTAWGVLNAVAEFVDHEAPYRGRLNELTDVRSAAILWGRGAKVKDKALAVVEAL
jgi:phage/plasmid-like protein (TIGR03299 family)